MASTEAASWVREDVDDAVDRRASGTGVQRAEDQVPGLGRRQCDTDGLKVAHLADQNDVRVLAQGMLERLGEGHRVLADAALADQRLPVLVHELDGILDRDDVRLARAVGSVDDRGQRRRLARAGRPSDEHEAARQHREVGQDRRHQQRFERLDLPGDGPQDGTHAAALLHEVDAEPGRARELVGEVKFLGLLELLLLLVRKDRVDGLLQLMGGQRPLARDRLEVAEHPDHRR
jgi:hypothetical protein